MEEGGERRKEQGGRKEMLQYPFVLWTRIACLQNRFQKSRFHRFTATSTNTSIGPTICAKLPTHSEKINVYDVRRVCGRSTKTSTSAGMFGVGNRKSHDEEVHVRVGNPVVSVFTTHGSMPTLTFSTSRAEFRGTEREGGTEGPGHRRTSSQTQIPGGKAGGRRSSAAGTEAGEETF